LRLTGEPLPPKPKHPLSGFKLSVAKGESIWVFRPKMAISKPLLHLFFERIKYPQSQHPKDRLQFLSELQKYFITNIPFETLALHYSIDKNVSLEMADIYNKIVTRKRGGYCHELNTLMSTVLRAMDLPTYAAVCRFWNPRAQPPQYRPMYVFQVPHLQSMMPLVTH
jgi:arylamine N-acetyltransferase